MTTRRKTRRTTTTKHLPRKLRGAAKTHGGKHYLARRIIGLMPRRIGTYIEGCVGGGSVFANLDPSVYATAVINDNDYPTYAIWSCLLNARLFEQFHARVKDLPYTEEAFTRERDRRVGGHADDGMVDVAVREYVVRNMSRGGMGESFAWSDRTRGGRPGDANAWHSRIAELPRLHEKTKAKPCAVSLGDVNAWLDSDLAQDPDNLFYLDPPYPPDTRTCPDVYSKEMDAPAHVHLVGRLRDGGIKAKVVVSGYHCPLYDEGLAGWHVVNFDMPNHSGQGDVKQRRTEVVWTNYRP